ncbi:MAG: YebC/PmpR family DNA-binding transcriptional regulator [Candidatus Woykebacteria bacterium]
MSGHSKWSTIKRQKGATDAKRGAAFTKAANAITIAAREGGANPETNFKLRLAVDSAKRVNMPKGNIERAIARGSSVGKDGPNLEEVTYEGFGPGGVGILVEAVTDNRQRTAQEVRSAFDRSGGRLSGPGSVDHFFKPVAEIVLRVDSNIDPDQLLLTAAEAGAEDVEASGSEAVVYCKVTDLERVKNNLSARGLEVIETKISRQPTTTIKIEEEKLAASVLSLVDKLEELADVQTVYANFDIPEEVLKKEVYGSK